MKMVYYKYELADLIRPIFLSVAFFCLSIPLFSSQSLENQDNPTKEEDLKAVFIYNFTKYVFWSDNDTSLTFNISIIGESNIVFPLNEIANSRKVGEKEIIINKIKDINNLSQSHVLFISESERDRLPAILNQINQKNTLTVSDSDGFAKMGVGINFLYINGNIRFELNQTSLERAGLKVSSQLLRLAVLVDEVGL